MSSSRIWSRVQKMCASSMRQAAHPGQAVHHAGLLVAVHGAELEEPQRKFAIRPPARPEDQAVHRAVHRLEVVVLARLAHRAVLVELGVDVHRREHAVGVPVQVARGVEQLRLGDVRGVDELVAGLDVLAPRVVLQLAADDAALGVENRQTGTDFVGEAEQVQFHAELAVVAPLRLLDQLEVPVQRLLRLPRGAVDALQAGVVLVAAPVRGRAAGQLERRDVLGGRDVRARGTDRPRPVRGCGD